MSNQRGWYFISITRDCGDSIHVDGLDVDAVYAETKRGALKEGRRRNPLKPAQDVMCTLAKGSSAERRALALNEKRNEQVAELRALVEKS